VATCSLPGRVSYVFGIRDRKVEYLAELHKANRACDTFSLFIRARTHDMTYSCRVRVREMFSRKYVGFSDNVCT